MTVQELILRLNAMPKFAHVVLNMTKNERANGREVKTVELVEAAYWKIDYDHPGWRPKWDPAEYHCEDDPEMVFAKIVSIES